VSPVARAWIETNKGKVMTEIQYQDPKALVDIKIKNRWFPSCHISWGIKIEDLWVGAFWKEETRPFYYSCMPEHWRHVWICLLPCLPIHISWRKS